MDYRKGDIFYVNLNNAVGDVQNGIRPCVVVSNNVYNERSKNVTIVPITSNLNRIIKTHVIIDKYKATEIGLKKESKILCENVVGISKEQLLQRVGHLTIELKKQINEALKIQLAL